MEKSKTETKAATTKWEADVINKIARKLSKRMVDIDLIFGIFTRGGTTCTLEEFKYTCLQRLNLKYDLTDKDLDLFLSNKEKLKGKNFMTRGDFMELFSGAIVMARREG